MTPQVPGWVRNAVFYQVFPDRFASSARVPKPGPLEAWDAPPTPAGFKGGDLLGIAERLDELADLGVTALYLTPIFSSASNHRYHTYDYMAVDPMLGGAPALRELVDALHARGMRIVLDGVFNHTGRGFWPFHHVVETGLASPYLDWFHFDRRRLAQGHGVQPYPGRRSHAGEAADHARDLKHETGYAAWWDLPALPKLNTDHPPVREYVFQVAEHWLRFGIDGWRLDVPEEIADPAFWAEFRRRCRAVNPEAYLVGEIWRLAPDWVSGHAFDALMNYPLQKALLAFTGGSVLDREVLGFHPDFSRKLQPLDAAGFAAELRVTLAAYPAAHVAAQLNLLSSHDIPRFRTIAGGDAAALRLATLLQMSLPGAPCVYYGDEVGMQGRRDPDCRRAFPRPGDPRDDDMRACVRALIAARAAHAALRSDRVAVAAATEGMLLLERGGADDPLAGGETLLVGVNAGTAAASCSVRLPALAGRRAEPLALPGLESAPGFALDAAGAGRAHLAPRSGAIWRV
jgi:cyclomaltodextrinase / maltogenic alpha-amylase / neopullulanase